MSRRSSISLPRDARVGEAVERLAGEVGRQLDEREVRTDLDRAEVAAAETALVGERADDLAGLDAVALADGDAIRRQGRSLGARARRSGAVAAVVAVEARRGPVAPVGAIVALDRAAALRLGLEQERRLALRDDRERGGDIDLGHVVVADVVGDDVAESLDAVGLAERSRDAVVEACEARDVDLVDARQLHLGELLARGALDGADEAALAGRDEADRVARASGAAGAADAVHVRLGVGGDVEVHDVRDALDVEAAGGDIRGDQDVELARLELVDGALALHLGDVAVDRGRGVAAGAELLGDLLGRALGAREDDHALEVLDLEDAREGVDLLLERDDEVALRGASTTSSSWS